ncbi:MAG: NADH-quinone oxidoreductase subunit J family protein [Candidatus Binataceae bacterium]
MLAEVIFYLLAALTLGSAMIVAFSRNIIYSAFALLGTFMGVVGVYLLLAADFVAMVQLLIYVGGILVLTIFAVMLTAGIADVTVSNRAVGGVPALVTIGVVGIVMLFAVYRTPWHQAEKISVDPTTYGLGNAFLNEYLLPFEVASLVLLTALIGAIVISRHEAKE